MSIAVKTSGWERKIYAIARTIAVSVVLSSCGTSMPQSEMTWKTYHNSRYGFEFSYPSNWISPSLPENDDGITFVSPLHRSVSMISWAGNQLPKSINEDETNRTTNPNFQTAQGVSGVLTIEVGKTKVEMTLKLTRAHVNYYWQGQCDRQQFGDYYRFFGYVAQQYKIGA
ncbi:MAG: hypothetical protein PUP92_09370 [Rhizonema sp. PD38]|nr:hypothetical protein [Rhizonema sp. PD38]